jgi:two-component system, OmpR family, alkaline phosphatase synthesis response regulator PhoP
VRTILLVDDSRFQRMAIERALVRGGYNVLTAGDGDLALQIARNKLPDLILLDLILPKVQGTEVLRDLKKNPATLTIPVVVLSSLSQKNEAKLAAEGAAAYLEKSAVTLDQSCKCILRAIDDILGNLPKQACTAIVSGRPYGKDGCRGSDEGTHDR